MRGLQSLLYNNRRKRWYGVNGIRWEIPLVITANAHPEHSQFYIYILSDAVKTVQNYTYEMVRRKLQFFGFLWTKW